MVAGEGATGFGEEEFQQAEFLGSEIDELVTFEELVRGFVEGEVAEGLEFGFFFFVSSEEVTGTGHEFADGEGLGDVVVGTEVEAADDVFFLAEGSEHKNRHIEVFAAEGLADFEAVEAGEHDI